jgi:hypothetical protein
MMQHHAPHPALRDALGLAVIGRTVHDLLGIRYNEGEGGNTPPAGGQEPPKPTPPTPTPPAAATPPAGATEPPAPNPPKVKFEDLDAETQAYVRGLRAEAADNRKAADAAAAEAAAAKAQRDKVLAAMGLKPDGSEQDPDPAALESKLTVAAAETENTKRENLVLRVGPGLGANVDKLLDSRSFTNKLAALKVDDREGVTALITEAITADVSLKSAPAPAASSGGTTHTGTTPSDQRKSKAAALQSRYAGGRGSAA